jgi:branched-chain amino acid aminotransferase
MGDFIYNGKIYKEGTAVVSAGNRGLRYGDGLFETIKMLDGKLVLKDEHFARLWKGMLVLGFEIPKHFTPEKLAAEIAALAKKNRHEKKARIRLQVFRGNGGLYDAVSHVPNYIIETAELPENNGQLNSNGLVLGIYKGAKKSCDMVSSFKHNNYLPYVLAALQAKKEKWNDAIVLNSQENICDSTIANVFIVKNEEVFTPALSQGCVAGVMREQCIQVLKTTAWKVKETAITVDDILKAEEVFLTNSIYNIRWVKSIGSNDFTNVITQKIYAAVLPTIV